MADPVPTPELIASMEALEAARVARDHETWLINQRSEMVRVASATLIENNRSKPVEEREITASAITAYADTLVTFINQK
jgi:hypothetical protein